MRCNSSVRCAPGGVPPGAFILLLCLLVACATPSATPSALPPPTETPPLTDTPIALPTSTIVTPTGPWATDQAAREATSFARATLSPFPTASAARVQAGRPASVTGRRDGLSIQVELPGDSYLAGEGGQAQVTIRNDGAETVVVYGNGHEPSSLMLLDEQGHWPDPWPWQDWVRSGPPYIRTLAPGGVITQTTIFQVPPLEQIANHQYVLWVWTRFSRPAPDNPQGPDNIWFRLESGPLPLQISAPPPSQRLHADLQADRTSWHLKVTDGQGHVPGHPLWGLLQVATETSQCGANLRDNSSAEWSGAWECDSPDRQRMVRAWVAAPGYVTAAITTTVPGNGNAARLFGYTPPPPHLFSSLAAAQAASDVPIYQPRSLPGGTALDHVRVETNSSDGNRYTTITSSYHMGSGAWLELVQTHSTEQPSGASWGQARYDTEAQLLQVANSPAYLAHQLGWWMLDWRRDNMGFEFQAPTAAMSAEQLRGLAESVQQ